MSSRNMKLDEIKARAQAAFEKTEQRKRDALVAWQALDDQASQTRVKTEKLKALRLARDAEEAATKAAAAPKKTAAAAKKAAGSSKASMGKTGVAKASTAKTSVAKAAAAPKAASAPRAKRVAKPA